MKLIFSLVIAATLAGCLDVNCQKPVECHSIMMDCAESISACGEVH